MNRFGARLSSFGGSRNIPPAVRAAAVASGASPYDIVSLDFANQQYWRQGVRSSLAAIPGFTATGGVNGTRQTAAGIVSASAPRINTAGSRGLVVGGAGTRVSPSPRSRDGWTSLGSPTITELETDSSGFEWRRLRSGGSTEDGDRITNIETVANGAVRYVRARYRASAVAPSAQARIALFEGGGDFAEIDGPLGALTVDTQILGAIEIVSQDTLAGGEYEVVFRVTFSQAAKYNLLVTANSGGGTTNAIELGGAQITDAPSGWIFDNPPGQSTRTADVNTLDMSDLGLASDQEWAVTYADGSTGTLNAVAGTLTFPASAKVYASAYAVAS